MQHDADTGGAIPAARKRRTKITALVIVFLVLALVAVGLTLLESWKLEGSAAAINDVGSERMRAYHIAFLVSEIASGRGDAAMLRAQVLTEVARFEDTLAGLRRGDPARPLFLSRAESVRRQLGDVERRWHDIVKPLALAVLDATNEPQRIGLVGQYRLEVERFVGVVNELVLTVEREIARDTAMLRFLQMVLMALACAASLAMACLLFRLVVRPVTRLQESLERIQKGDFGVRLPVESKDEFGVLAAGFNRMADHLQGLYRTLEDRVAQKTQSLEEKNRGLSTL